MFGDLRCLKRSIVKRIEESHRLEEVGVFSESQRLERKELSNRLEESRFKEEIAWSQKAKVKWFKEGDNNTKFFHSGKW